MVKIPWTIKQHENNKVLVSYMVGDVEHTFKMENVKGDTADDILQTVISEGVKADYKHHRLVGIKGIVEV